MPTAKLDPKPLTVAQLRTLLERMPADAEVAVEGCDCWGDANSIALLTDGRVLIERDDSTARPEKDEVKLRLR